MSRAYPSIAIAPACASIRAALFAVLCAGAAAVHASPGFAALLPPDTLAQLVSAGRLSHSFQEHGLLSLPPSSRLREEAQREMDAVAPSAGAEILVFQKSPSRTILDSGAGELSLYNTMRSMSAMKGMPYWSASRNRPVTLFRDSYVIESPKVQKRRDDPLVASIPERDELYIVQDDSTFGRNVYRATYEHRDGILSLKIANVEAISMILFPIIKPGNLVLRFLLAPSGDSLVFWGACYVRIDLSVVGRAEIESSVMNRLSAMVDWAVGRLR